MRTKLNKITLTVSVMLAMAFTFSFSQEVVRLAEPPEKPVAYDKVHNLNPDSLTVALLKESQAFYSNSFKDLLTAVTILIAIGIAILALFNINSEKSLSQKMKHEIQSEFEIIKKKFKEDIENALKKDRTENQKKFDISFRFMSRIYRKLAESFLGEEPKFYEFFYFMHIFYRCLISINSESLNGYDLDRLKRTLKLFSEKVEKTKNIKMNTPIENKDNICWFIIYLLKFAKQCDCNEQNEYSYFTKSIYRILFNFSDFNYDNIKIEIENCMKKDNNEPLEIQEILKLSENYRDNLNI